MTLHVSRFVPRNQEVLETAIIVCGRRVRSSESPAQHQDSGDQDIEGIDIAQPQH